MCVSPSYIYTDKGPDFERLQVACGWCWSCQKNRLNDLVGRCLCEASHCDWVYAVTLSYRQPWPAPLTSAAESAKNQRHPDALQIKSIQKQDAQAFLKHLRHSVKTRYLVAGEYGSKTNRTHFHVILFGRGTPPSWELKKNTHIDQWPWGHVYVDDQVSETALRYTSKYLLKGAKRKRSPDDNKYNKEWISYSRIPIMGIEYVLELAAQYAAERVVPHSFKYRPPMAQANREYHFTGEAQYVFITALLDLWPEVEHIKKNKQMERAFVRTLKERHRRRFDALPPSEQKKALDVSMRSTAQLSQRDLRLYGAFLHRRMTDGKIETVSQFAEACPEDYSTVKAIYRRDLTQKPPTYDEAGYHFTA